MSPKHPYTRLLRESIPQADPTLRWQGRVTLSETEEQEYLRQGCKFAGRCPAAMTICRQAAPPLIMVGDVAVKCHLYGANEAVELIGAVRPS